MHGAIVTCCSIFIIARFTSIYRIIAGAYSYLWLGVLHTPLCQWLLACFLWVLQLSLTIKLMMKLKYGWTHNRCNTLYKQNKTRYKWHKQFSIMFDSIEFRVICHWSNTFCINLYKIKSCSIRLSVNTYPQSFKLMTFKLGHDLHMTLIVPSVTYTPSRSRCSRMGTSNTRAGLSYRFIKAAA
jgi:hypothetical protein